jgi:D-alanyl-D-alanine carboxypeptidase/D-alanyl-D-alanine-endopeptidase (penicillin-binding protein 4)
MRRFAAALVLVATLGPRSGAAPLATGIRGADEIRERLAAVFDTTDVNALWAIKVVSLDSGETVFERNPRLLVMPASTMKIVTLAVASERLGWDARFTTRVETTGAVEDGVLRGDLIVTGDGDPTIVERDDAPRVLDDLALQLSFLGIRRIEGRLVGDDDALPDQALGSGWAWDDLPFGFAAPVGALQFNESAADLVISAGAEPNAPASMRLEPGSSELAITGGVWTTAADVPPLVFTRRRPFTRVVEVSGHVPMTGRDYVRPLAVDNPTRAFVLAFRDALGRAGIAVTGDAADIDDLADKPAGVRTLLLASQSPPLRDLAVRLMKESQNLIAETLLTRIALVSDSPDVELITAARGGYERTLERWGVPGDQVIVADGSGLSRYDYVTAEALVAILTRMARQPADAAAFEPTLPIMGVDGTLAKRLKGTRAEGRIHAKTGTMSNVRALAGYLTTDAGERLAFAIVGNNFKGRAATIDAVVDRALLALIAKDRGRCCRGR